LFLQFLALLNDFIDAIRREVLGLSLDLAEKGLPALCILVSDGTWTIGTIALMVVGGRFMDSMVHMAVFHSLLLQKASMSNIPSFPRRWEIVTRGGKAHRELLTLCETLKTVFIS
jgi:hypothetical protein